MAFDISRYLSDGVVIRAVRSGTPLAIVDPRRMDLVEPAFSRLWVLWRGQASRQLSFSEEESTSTAPPEWFLRMCRVYELSLDEPERALIVPFKDKIEALARATGSTS